MNRSGKTDSTWPTHSVSISIIIYIRMLLRTKGSPVKNFAGTTGINWDSPKQTGMHDDSTHKGIFRSSPTLAFLGTMKHSSISGFP